jgi:hypothetical protein
MPGFPLEARLRQEDANRMSAIFGIWVSELADGVLSDGIESSRV